MNHCVWTDTAAELPQPGLGRTIADLAVIGLFVLAVVAISLHAPSDLYAYAQVWNIGAGIGMLQDGEWILPRNQDGEFARKPQLFPWLVALAVSVTGVYEDIVFRLPTIVASLASVVGVYLLSRRWYGRRVALLAGCLWATAMHMHKMMALATTDMLLSLWILMSIVCVDRLVFHPARRSRRWAWAVGFWASMILAALSKGWGLVNFAVVGGLVAAGAAVRPGFKALGRGEDLIGKGALLCRLVLRRWWRAIKAVRLGWGLLAFAAVFVPLWIVMLAKGGAEFKDLLHFEIRQRITGGGTSPPSSATAPVALFLLYYLLPTSVFAVGSLLLVRPRRWFARRCPLALPLLWVLAVVVPFSLAHGFRPDYLLPCYPAVAMMGAWAIEQVFSRGPSAGAVVRALRHVFAAPAVVIGAGLTLFPWLYIFGQKMPSFVARAFGTPVIFGPQTAAAFWLLIGLGVAVFVLGVRFSLRWQLKRVAWVTAIGMLGVLFLYGHGFSSHARGDGDRIVAFARQASRIIGQDEFAVDRVQKLGIELFVGRFGRKIDTLADIRRADADWLITSDWGMRETSANLQPGMLGRVALVGGSVDPAPNHGRLYLIRLDRSGEASWPQSSIVDSGRPALALPPAPADAGE